MIDPKTLSAAGARLLIGYSGGLDSGVLLHSVLRAAQQLNIVRERIVGVHINHGAHPDAGAWEAFCSRQCAELGVRCLTRQIAVTTGGNFEALARAARYRVFAEHVRPDDWLLLAHHRNDQAETLLLNLFRGSGQDGLAAMPERRPFEAGWLVRPLLHRTKDEMRAWAQAHKIQWIEDPSNADTQHSRNYLRHQIAPLLATRWPGWEQVLSRTSALLGQQRGLLEQLLSERLEVLGHPETGLDMERLLADGDGMAAEVIRHCLRHRGWSMPRQAQMLELLRQSRTARKDAAVSVGWGRGRRAVVARLYRGRLWLGQPLERHPSGIEGDWRPQQRVRYGLGAVVLGGRYGQGGFRLSPGDSVRVQFRRGGERMRLSGGARQQLKNLMQQAGIPPWLRSRLPLLYLDGELVAVPGVGIAARHRSKTRGWHCDLYHAGDSEAFLSTASSE